MPRPPEGPDGNNGSVARGTILVAMFVVVMIQLHLALLKSAPPSGCLLPLLDGFKGLRNNSMALRSTEEQVASANASTGLTAPTSKQLPEINEMGMIIFYLHIPKTGGTTMVAPFQANPHWRYRMVYGWNKQNRYREEMYETLQNWQPGMRIFYEYHAGLSSPFMDVLVREDLLKWRAMAQVRKIPFFAFTVLREPLSFAVSFFNYYYASRKGQDQRYYFVENPTEDDFVRLSLPNPQCLFCVRTEQAYYKFYRESGRPVDVSEQECRQVYQFFTVEFDWVGTTESLSTETFPLLQHVANIRYLPMTKNKSTDKIVLGELKPESVAHIRNLTKYDSAMYQQARADFPMAMWSNFRANVPRPQPLPDHIPHLKMKKFDKPDLLGWEERRRAKEEGRTYQPGGHNNRKKGKKKKQDPTPESRLPLDQTRTWNTAA